MYKDNLVWSTADWSDEFKVEFDVIVTKELVSQVHNVFHITTGDNVCEGCRNPAVWANSAKYFTICSNVNGNNNYCQNKDYLLNQPNHIEILQRHDSNGNAVYSIIVDGNTFHETINTSPMKFQDVKLYLSDPWHESLAGYGKLSNFRVTTPDSKSKIFVCFYYNKYLHYIFHNIDFFFHF